MSSGRPKIQTPEDPAPTATPIPGREEEEAKKKVKKRAGAGREGNILAGRMNADTLKTQLG